MKRDDKSLAEQVGDLRFRELLDRLWEMHCRKAKDYGDSQDFLANLHSSEEFGIPAWLGAMLRLNDKVYRLQAYAKKKTLANEGVEDTLLDLASYALIALILHREENPRN